MALGIGRSSRHLRGICATALRRVGATGTRAKERGAAGTVDSVGTADEIDDPLERVYSAGCLASLLDVSLPECGGDATRMERAPWTRNGSAAPTAVHCGVPSRAPRVKPEEADGAEATARGVSFTDAEGRRVRYQLRARKKQTRSHFLELRVDDERIQRGRQSITMCDVSGTIYDGSHAFPVASGDVPIVLTSLRLLCKVGAVHFDHNASPERVQ